MAEQEYASQVWSAHPMKNKELLNREGPEKGNKK